MFIDLEADQTYLTVPPFAEWVTVVAVRPVTLSRGDIIASVPPGCELLVDARVWDAGELAVPVWLPGGFFCDEVSVRRLRAA